jgi:hypothetical protein
MTDGVKVFLVCPFSSIYLFILINPEHCKNRIFFFADPGDQNNAIKGRKGTTQVPS